MNATNYQNTSLEEEVQATYPEEQTANGFWFLGAY